MNTTLSDMLPIEMIGVREYEEGEPVSLVEVDGRLVIKALNEAGCNGTFVDLLDLLYWVERNLFPFVNIKVSRK